MSDYHINIFFSEEDGGYIAEIPDLVACSAFGASPKEALAEALDMLEREWRSRRKPGWMPRARRASRSLAPATARRVTR